MYVGLANIAGGRRNYGICAVVKSDDGNAPKSDYFSENLLKHLPADFADPSKGYRVICARNAADFNKAIPLTLSEQQSIANRLDSNAIEMVALGAGALALHAAEKGIKMTPGLRALAVIAAVGSVTIYAFDQAQPKSKTKVTDRVIPQDRPAPPPDDECGKLIALTIAALRRYDVLLSMGLRANDPRYIALDKELLDLYAAMKAIPGCLVRFEAAEDLAEKTGLIKDRR